MKFLTKAAIAGVAVSASVLSMAPAAFADGDPSDCGSGYACLWVDIHYLTNGSRFTHLDTFYYRPTLPSSYDAKASSAYNAASNQGAYFYKGQRCPSGGARFLLAANTGDSDFTNGSPAGNFQDAIRSLTYNSSSLISQCRAG